MNRATIAYFFRPGSPMAETAELIRREPSPYPDGRDAHGNYVPGKQTTRKIRVISAPLTGEQRLILPAGLRSVESRNFWTDETLQGLTDKADADQLKYDGKLYRVTILEDWDGFFQATGTAPSED